MKTQIVINEFDLKQVQTGAHEYKIIVFKNTQLQFQFKVSLQPTGKDDILPTYQLLDKSIKVPSWVHDNLNIISDWLKE